MSDAEGDLCKLVALAGAVVRAGQDGDSQFDALRAQHSEHYESIRARIGADEDYAKAYAQAWRQMKCASLKHANASDAALDKAGVTGGSSAHAPA